MSDFGSPRSCPLCRQPLAKPHHIDVCAACYESLAAGDDIGAGDDIAVTSTGEFNAFGYEVMTGPGTAEPLAKPGDAGATTCTWCGKRRDDVKKILTSGTAHICDECVALCAEIMAAELGDDWRRR